MREPAGFGDDSGSKAMITPDSLLQSMPSWLSAELMNPAFAYLDPGTGSMIIQLLLGGIAGAMVVGKLYWHRFKSFLGRKGTASTAPSQDD
ncbi:MAG: hypothetical protein ACTSW2_05730 [Alphaproteobacteria bacterium]